MSSFASSTAGATSSSVVDSRPSPEDDSNQGVTEQIRSTVYTLLSTVLPSRLLSTSPLPPSASSPRLRVPDLLKDWPWPAMKNPVYSDRLRDEVQAYFLALPGIRDSEQLQKVVHKSYVPILTALMFPNVTEGQLRAIMKFAQWTIVIEDPLEQEDDLQVVDNIVNGSVQTLREPDAVVALYPDEFGRAVSLASREQFSTSRIYNLFIDGITTGFLPSIVRKATQHKFNTAIPPIEEWLAIRRHNYAFDCFPALLELDDPLPEDIVHGPLLQSFVRRAGTMCVLENDLYSHNKDQAHGDTYNTLRVVQHHYGLDLAGSVDWLEAEHTRIMHEYLDAYHNLPSFGSADIDRRVREWVSDLGRLVRGNLEWHFLAPRYFGTNGARVRRQGYVDLLPKKEAAAEPQSILAST